MIRLVRYIHRVHLYFRPRALSIHTVSLSYQSPVGCSYYSAMTVSYLISLSIIYLPHYLLSLSTMHLPHYLLSLSIIHFPRTYYSVRPPYHSISMKYNMPFRMPVSHDQTFTTSLCHGPPWRPALPGGANTWRLLGTTILVRVARVTIFQPGKMTHKLAKPNAKPTVSPTQTRKVVCQTHRFSYG